MKPTKNDLIEAVHDQIKKDCLEKGDTTVLFELFQFIPIENLIQSLGEDQWKNYEHLKKNVKMGNSLKVAKDDQKKVIKECMGDYWYLYDEAGISIIGTEEGFNTEEEANDYANDNDLTIVTSFNLG